MSQTEVLKLKIQQQWFSHMGLTVEDIRNFLPGTTQPVTLTVSVGNREFVELILLQPEDREFTETMLQGIEGLIQRKRCDVENKLKELKAVKQ